MNDQDNRDHPVPDPADGSVDGSVDHSAGDLIPALSHEPDQDGPGPAKAPHTTAEFEVVEEPGAPTRTPRKRLPPWAVAAVAVGIFVVAFLLMRYVLPGGSTDAGGCASVTGNDENAALTALSCEDDDATFRIASTNGDREASCPEGAYRELRDASTLRCLMPNFQAGRCYEPDDANRAFRQAGCEGEEAIRVTQVIDGTSDPARCPGGNGLGYPEPAVVYCLETPGT